MTEGLDSLLYLELLCFTALALLIFFAAWTYRKQSTVLSNIKYKDKLGTRVEYFANIAHEIRTPLNGIIGITDLMLDSELSKEQKSYLELIKESGHNLLTLINDILDFSKIESGKLTLNTETVEIRKLIDRSLKILGIRAEQKNICLVSSIDEKVAQFIKADSLRIKQLIQNFISNSIKFTNSYGAIVLFLTAEIKNTDTARLLFAVSDTGIGIPKDKKDLIFESFKQADSFTASHYGGTGLGLSICKKIIQLMNGDIRVESKEGIGTAFHFSIEVGIEDSKNIESNLPNTEKLDSDCLRQLKPKILLCEDNAINAKLVTAILQKKGMEITTASNGVQAIEILKNHEFDLILMDCQMPIMDGYETTMRIRKGGMTKNPSIPIVALTANTDSLEKERCLNCGMDAFIAKPIDKESFIKTVKSQLSGKLYS